MDKYTFTWELDNIKITYSIDNAMNLSYSEVLENFQRFLLCVTQRMDCNCEKVSPYLMKEYEDEIERLRKRLKILNYLEDE